MSAIPAPERLGMIFDESHSAYHASSAFGSHDLDDLDPYPLLFRKRHVEKSIPPDADTPAKLFGRYFHALALEGEAVADALFTTIPNDAPDDFRRFRNSNKKSAATLESIAWWDDFDARRLGKEIITQSQFDLAWRMVKSIREKPGVAALFSQGKPEVTFRHKMAAFTLQCRCDWFEATPTGGGPPLIIDVKTVETLGDFDKQFLNLGYYRQAAFYQLVVAAVMKLEKFEPQHIFVVIEKNETFQTAVRIADAESLDIGRREVLRSLAKLKDCFDRNDWPGEPDEPRSVSLPEWKARQSLA